MKVELSAVQIEAILAAISLQLDFNRANIDVQTYELLKAQLQIAKLETDNKHLQDALRMLQNGGAE